MKYKDLQKWLLNYSDYLGGQDKAIINSIQKILMKDSPNNVATVETVRSRLVELIKSLAGRQSAFVRFNKNNVLTFTPGDVLDKLNPIKLEGKEFINDFSLLDKKAKKNLLDQVKIELAKEDKPARIDVKPISTEAIFSADQKNAREEKDRQRKNELAEQMRLRQEQEDRKKAEQDKEEKRKEELKAAEQEVQQLEKQKQEEKKAEIINKRRSHAAQSLSSYVSIDKSHSNDQIHELEQKLSMHLSKSSDTEEKNKTEIDLNNIRGKSIFMPEMQTQMNANTSELKQNEFQETKKMIELIMKYINALPQLYKDSPQYTNSKKGMIDSFVNKMNSFNNDKVKVKNPEEKLFITIDNIFLEFDALVKSKLKINSFDKPTQKEYKEYINLLNTEKNDHHYARLLGMVLKDLSNLNRDMEFGEPLHKSAHFIGSYKKVFDDLKITKPDKGRFNLFTPKDSYESAKNLLPSSQLENLFRHYVKLQPQKASS